MTNQERRMLLEKFRSSGMEGSIMDVYQAYGQGVDLVDEHLRAQNQGQPATLTTPEEQQQGLRPYHDAGELNKTAVFKDVPPNTPFNTHGMKAPINIEKYSQEGHLIESHKSVPPGISNIPTGPYEGDVIETPADGYQTGGFVDRKQTGGFKYTPSETETEQSDNTRVNIPGLPQQSITPIKPNMPGYDAHFGKTYEIHKNTASADISKAENYEREGTVSQTPPSVFDFVDKPQTFNVPIIDEETGKVKNSEYNTSIREEFNRTGIEPTFTFTSAGGPGAGFRGYFPYSDPLGIGLEVDLDPTGPGGGLLFNNAKIRQAGNYIANKTGTDFTRDMNLPPGFTYAGAEMAGNALSPFVGATVSLEDTHQLQDYLDRPENQGKKDFSKTFMRGLGPALHYWNAPSKLSGQITIHNPFNVMGKPLLKTPDLFRGRKIHNPISGTGIGLGGRTGIRGGNIVPHFEIGSIEQGVRGGFAAIKDEVLEAADDLMKADRALSKEAAMKQAYDDIAGKFNIGKTIEKTKIPQALDAAGEAIYGTKGAAGYNKSGNTLASKLRNLKIPYGKVLNHPWFWKGISRGLMVPDAINLAKGAVHQKGTPISDAYEPVFGPDPNAGIMQQYGAFPRAQLFYNEGIDPVLGVKWFDSAHEKAMKKDQQVWDIMQTLKEDTEYMDKFPTEKEQRKKAEGILNDRNYQKQTKSNPYFKHNLQTGGVRKSGKVVRKQRGGPRKKK